MTPAVLAITITLMAGACTPSRSVTPSDLAAKSPQSIPSSHEHPDCRFISPTNPRYGGQIAPVSAHAGDTVAAFGTTLRGEDGRYSPAHKIEVWWNARWPLIRAEEKPIKRGSPVRLLATIKNTARCHFHAEFEVPDVLPGVYAIRTFVYYKGGNGLFGRDRFTVR